MRYVIQEYEEFRQPEHSKPCSASGALTADYLDLSNSLAFNYSDQYEQTESRIVDAMVDTHLKVQGRNQHC